MSAPVASDDFLDLDLDRGLPTTSEDVEALRRHRPGPMTLDEYVAFLATFPPLSREALRARKVPKGEPFRLE